MISVLPGKTRAHQMSQIHLIFQSKNEMLCHESYRLWAISVWLWPPDTVAEKNKQAVVYDLMGFLGGSVAKNPSANSGDPWVRKILGKRNWQPTPVFLPGKAHWQSSLGRLQSTGSQRVRLNWAPELNWNYKSGPEVPPLNVLSEREFTTTWTEPHHLIS